MVFSFLTSDSRPVGHMRQMHLLRCRLAGRRFEFPLEHRRWSVAQVGVALQTQMYWFSKL